MNVKDSDGNDIFCVKVNNSGVVMTNLTDQIMYYLVIELETSRLIDLDPNYTTWYSIAGGKSITVPYEDIIGYDDSAKEVVIVWVLGEGESSDYTTIPL